jgi:hypothetical protein
VDRTWRAVGAVLLAATLAGCSHTSTAEQRASICPDLANLAGTMRVAFSPPADATVGDVRNALEKLESTWGHIAQASAIASDQRTEISQARLDYLKAVANVGDDDPVSSVASRTAGPASRLAADTAAVWRLLGCPGRPPGA